MVSRFCLYSVVGEEQADQDQAGAGAERVLDHGVQAALDELGRDAHHGFGAEPGREGGGDHHDQRQAAAGDGEVGRVLDARAGPDADGSVPSRYRTTKAISV